VVVRHAARREREYEQADGNCPAAGHEVENVQNHAGLRDAEVEDDLEV
jgi:hypothetical protein